MSGTYSCEYTIHVYNDIDIVKIKCPDIVTPTLPNHGLWSYGDGKINVKWGGLIKNNKNKYFLILYKYIPNHN